MSQRKKQLNQGSPSATSGRSAATLPRTRERGPISRRETDSRRRIAIGIVVIGVIVAASILAVSFGSGGSGSTNNTASQTQQNSNTQALDADIANLQKTLQQDPSNLGAMVSLGNDYYDTGRYSEAIPWYEKALQSAPTNTDVRTDLGTAYFYSGDLDKAKEQWFKVLEQDPNKVQTHYNLAVLYSHETPPDTDNAVKEWQTVIKLAPDSDQAKSAQKRLQDLGKE